MHADEKLTAFLETESLTFGVDLISDGCGITVQTPSRMQSGYAQHCSRSQNAAIRVYNEATNVVETHEHKGDFRVV